MQTCKLLLGAMALAAMTLTGGCQRITYRTAPEKGIYAGPVEGRTVGQFDLQRKGHFIFWGLKAVNVPDLQQAAAEKLQPGQALGNVRVEEVNSFVDGLLAAVTVGIYRPRTVHITGTIYDTKGGQ